MLKAELEALAEQQAARIAELEAEGPEVRGYLVFGWQEYSAGGGWDDYRQCFATQEAAQECAEAYIAERSSPDSCAFMAQVVELPTGRVQRFGEE
jgi:hypothetical protein